MGTSPTLTGATEYSTLSSGTLSGNVSNQAAPTYTMTATGSSATIGETVTVTVDGSGSVSSVYEGYYDNAGVEDPVILASGDYYVLGFASTVATVPVTSADYVFPCYVRGSLVLTDRGEVPVETLVRGDRVITAAGAARPVKWIGWRSYAGRFLASNRALQPIRFRAGSLGCRVAAARSAGVAAACHVRRWVPGAGAVPGERCQHTCPEPGLERVDYFHVELETHDRAGGGGGGVGNLPGRWRARRVPQCGRVCGAVSGAGARAAAYCAPRLESGWALDRIRRRLAGYCAVAA